MATTTTRRTARKTAATPAVQAETPAPTKSVRPATRRRPSAPKPPAAASVAEVVSDALTTAAAPTKIGPNGEMIRQTHEYTVDLRDPGMETERDFDKLLAKEPSEVHHDFVAWFEKHSGYKCDVRTVQYLIATYVSDFQKDPAQKAKTIAKRDAAAAKRGLAAAKKAEKEKAAAAAKK